MTNCPRCKTDGYYPGFQLGECRNVSCALYTEKQALEYYLTKENTDMEAQQAIAANLLHDILPKTYDPKQYAFVAGGAALNWHLKRPARDIDIYVSDPELIPKEAKLLAEGEEYPGPATVSQMTVSGISVDYIFPGSSDLLGFIINDFDFHICKVAWQPMYGGLGAQYGQGAFYVSIDASYDLQWKRLTYDSRHINRSNRLNKFPERVIKMKAYFPDHTPHDIAAY